MEGNPIYTLQNTLLHIIDTAALSEKMSNFSYGGLETITNFLLTGKWEAKFIQQPMTDQQPPNTLVTRPQHYDYGRHEPFLSNQSAEVERVESRLSGFDPKTSTAWQTITKLFGSEVKQVHLRAIAEDIASNYNFKLSKESSQII